MSGVGMDDAQAIWVAAVLLVSAAAAVRGVWSPCGLSMVSAINPFTERSRGHCYSLTAAWFVAGSVVGGALLGGVAVLGHVALSPLSHATALLVGIVCCAIAMAADSAVIPLRLPNHPRQVNEQWLGRYRRWAYAAGFGLQIGSGFATYIMTAAVYLTVLLGALSGSTALAFGAGLTFGLVRGLAVLLSSSARTPAMLHTLHRRLDVLSPWSMRAVMVVEASAAGLLGYGLGGPLGLVGVAVLVVLGAAVVVLADRRNGPTGQAVECAVVASCVLTPPRGGANVPMQSHKAAEGGVSWSVVAPASGSAGR